MIVNQVIPGKEEGNARIFFYIICELITREYGLVQSAEGRNERKRKKKNRAKKEDK